MTKVRLSYSEILQGAMVGVMRQVQNLKAGRTHRHGGSANAGWQRNIDGARGELARAKHLDVYIGGTGVMRGPDVGDCDVRTTAGADNRLILHPDDPDDRVFWLLTGSNGQYQVRGNILGAEGIQQNWSTDPVGGRPAYFVPQGELNDG